MTEVKEITGLTYQSEFITKETEAELIKFIDSQEWNTKLKRRTQHYGYEYKYDRSGLKPLNPVPEIFLKALGDQQTLFPEGPPNQVIVNEYLLGQGINAHIDDPIRFGKTIASLSLLSGIEMEFQQYSVDKHHVYLEPRSMVWLTQDARYKWTHQIRSRKFDTVPGEGRTLRSRRVSITYRHVLENK